MLFRPVRFAGRRAPCRGLAPAQVAQASRPLLVAERMYLAGFVAAEVVMTKRRILVRRDSGQGLGKRDIHLGDFMGNGWARGMVLLSRS